MDKILKIGLSVIVIIGLSNCTTIAPFSPSHPIAPKPKINVAQIKNWSISGKIAVQTNRESGSSNLDWRQQGNQFAIDLYGLLGSNRVHLIGNPKRVALTTADGKRYSASSPEELLARQWGFRVPVKNLIYWIRGLPAPGAFTPRYDNQGRLRYLSQGAWQVEFLDYEIQDGAMLPNKITIISAFLRAKIIIYQWRIA